MAVRMIGVGRLPRSANAHETHQIRRRVGEGMKSVGENADRAARVTEHNLGDGGREIQDEDPHENAGDGSVPVRAER